MNDGAIRRQAVLKLLYDLPPEEAITKAMLIQSVKQMDAAQPELRWIPCSERLPENDDDVLVTVYFAGVSQYHVWNVHLGPKYYVDVARYYEVVDRWDSCSDEYKIAISRHKVIAWCPLPEPYKGEP